MKHFLIAVFVLFFYGSKCQTIRSIQETKTVIFLHGKSYDADSLFNVISKMPARIDTVNMKIDAIVRFLRSITATDTTKRK